MLCIPLAQPKSTKNKNKKRNRSVRVFRCLGEYFFTLCTHAFNSYCCCFPNIRLPMPTIAVATAAHTTVFVFPLTHTHVRMCSECEHKCQCTAVNNCYTPDSNRGEPHWQIKILLNSLKRQRISAVRGKCMCCLAMQKLCKRCLEIAEREFVVVGVFAFLPLLFYNSQIAHNFPSTHCAHIKAGLIYACNAVSPAEDHHHQRPEVANTHKHTCMYYICVYERGLMNFLCLGFHNHFSCSEESITFIPFKQPVRRGNA